jgi:plastocyanin domain-containing protein
MRDAIVITLIISGSVIVAALLISNKPANSNNNTTPFIASSTSVSNEGDKQIVNVTAKGGYSPARIQASANKDTILRIKTNSTFDCSAALSIPSLGVNKMLPPTGSTDFEIGSQKAGTQLNGTCAMGMYNFSIYFN